MQRIFSSVLILFICCNAVLANPFEGVMTVTTTQGGKTTEAKKINLTVKGDQVVMDASAVDKSAPRILVNTSTGVAHLLMDGQGQKMAIKLNINSLKAAGGLSTFMGSKNNAGTGKEPTVKATTETKTINGYNCTKYLVTDDDNTSELWITKDITLDLSSLFGTTSKELANGMVMKGINKNTKTGETVTFDVKPTAQKVDDAVFKIPAGYQQMDMTQVVDQMMKTQKPEDVQKMLQGMGGMKK